jgi:hypothetical protein
MFKTDLEKIGVKTIKLFERKGRWVFDYEGQTYDMAPAEFTNMVLSPTIVGADRIISIGCNLKGIKNPENGFNLLFSDSYFPNADVKFNLIEPKFEGLVYSVEPLNLSAVSKNQSVWICSYLTLYFPKVPKELYLKIEHI